MFNSYLLCLGLEERKPEAKFEVPTIDWKKNYFSLFIEVCVQNFEPEAAKQLVIFNTKKWLIQFHAPTTQFLDSWSAWESL